MHYSNIIGKLGSSYIWHFCFYIDRKFNYNHKFFFKVFSSGLWIIQIGYICYALYFESAKIQKHCCYWNVFSPDIYRKLLAIFASQWMVWVDSINSDLFFDMLRNWGKFYTWGILVFLFIKSSIPTLLIYFSSFGLELVQFNFLATFCWSINSGNWVFESCNILRRCTELWILICIWYLKSFSMDILTVSTFSDIILVCKLQKSDV